MNNAFNALSAGEKAVVKKRDIAGGAAYDFDNPSDNVAGEVITEAGFWPLSVKEARLVNSIVLRFAAGWWLRSPGSDDPNYPNAANVSEFGNVWADGEYITNRFGIRPAFNLNLESVLFISAAEGGKSSATVGGRLVDAAVPTDALKLTIADSNMATPTLTLAETTNGTNAIGFDYSGAQTGENRYISCVLEDSNGKVKYYGKLADCTSNASGNLTISLAGVAKNETYTLKIFSEQAKGDNLTDYASAPITKTVTVDASGNGTVSNFVGTASVTVNKDGAPWLTDSPAITIGTTCERALVNGSVFANGTYNIYADGAHTGATITVNSTCSTATLNYYTIKFSVTDVESADGSTISATYDGDNIASDAVVLSGKKLVITAEGKSSAACTYAWSGSGTSGQTTNFITIDFLSGKVEATCTVSDLKKETYTVEVNGSYAADNGTGSYEQGAVVTIDAGSRSDYSFTGWTTVTDGVSFVTTGAAITTFKMPAGDVNVTATWSYNGSHNPSTDPEPSTPPAPASTPTPTPTPVPETRVVEGQVTTTIFAKPTTDANGKAVAPISEKMLTDAIAKAADEAAKQGTQAKTTVKVEVNAVADAKTVGVDLMAEALKKFVESKADTLQITTPFGTMTFDVKTAEGILKQSVGTITITATKVEAAELAAEIREKVGDRPVVSFDVTGNNKENAQLGGKAEITIPYTLKAGENPNAIVAYYTNSAGKLEIVANCKYDSATGTLTFKTENASRFAVAHNKVNFADVADYVWYGDAVTYAAARGITSGTGKVNFGPNDNVTRAQALVMMMKAFGISPAGNDEKNFSDAGNSYYTGYLAAAKNLGITSGVGGNKFAPDRQVTRQELFVLIYNTLKNMNELPSISTAKDLSDFKDKEKVADYANKAVELFVKTGIISGTDGNILPEDLASRAQFVQILYNIMMK